MQLSHNKILITGGASGMGLGLSERFLQEHNTVIICGRRAEALQEAAERWPSIITRVCDLAVEQERADLFRWIATAHPDLNVLVNNAGIQQWMQIGDEDFYARAKQEIVTNIEAPLHLTTLFLQLEKPDTVINVTSGLAFVPLAKVPVYAATKAFFHSFTQSVQYLLRARGIEVIELIPPALNTDPGGKGLHDTAPPVGDFIAAVFEQLRQGAQTISYGFSAQMAAAVPDAFGEAFRCMNPDTIRPA